MQVPKPTVGKPRAWLCACALSTAHTQGPEGEGATHRGLQAQAEGLGGWWREELPDARELPVQRFIFCYDLAQVLLPGETASEAARS